MATQQRELLFLDVDKEELMNSLVDIILNNLLEEERKIIYYRFVYDYDVLMPFNLLATHLHLGSTKQAKLLYKSALHKIRQAIPNTPVEALTIFHYIKE